MHILNATFKATLLTAAFSMSATAVLADEQQSTIQLAQASSEAGMDQSNQRTGDAKAQTDTSGNAGKSSGQSAQSDSSGASATGQKQAGQAAKADGLPPGHPPVFMIIPVEVANRDNAMKQGCWARIYDRENFTGDVLTLVGPVSLSDLQGPFGLNWDDRVNSIETGKKAQVMVYDNQDFRDPVTTFKPGQKVADVSKRLGFFDEFASLRITC